MQGSLSVSEILRALQIKHKPTLRDNYLHPAQKMGLISYTIPDKPNSRLQKYQLTVQGREWLKTKLS